MTCGLQLERWVDAVRDYEVLRRELPADNEVAESLFHAQVALKKSRGEEVYNMKFGGEVEEVSSLEQFRAAISSPGNPPIYLYQEQKHIPLLTFIFFFLKYYQTIIFLRCEKNLICRCVRCPFQSSL
jgi:hypothetical protein